MTPQTPLGCNNDDSDGRDGRGDRGGHGDHTWMNHQRTPTPPPWKMTWPSMIHTCMPLTQKMMKIQSNHPTRPPRPPRPPRAVAAAAGDGGDFYGGVGNTADCLSSPRCRGECSRRRSIPSRLSPLESARAWRRRCEANRRSSFPLRFMEYA